MFRAPDQYVVVTKMGGVRVKDKRQNDRTHLVEFGFEVPLTVELCNDIGARFVRDLFDKGKDGFVPKDEFSGMTLNLDTGINRVTVKGAPVPEAEALICTIETATFKHLKVAKSSAGVWMLSWVAQFPVDMTAIKGLIGQLKQPVYITIERVNPKLGLVGEGEGEAPADGAPAEVEEARTPRRRGRPQRATA
jgi:hypothetical protein